MHNILNFLSSSFSNLLSNSCISELQIVCEQTFIAASWLSRLLSSVSSCQKPSCFKPLFLFSYKTVTASHTCFPSSYLPCLFLFCFSTIFALFPPHSRHPSCFRLRTQFLLSRWFHFLLLII